MRQYDPTLADWARLKWIMLALIGWLVVLSILTPLASVDCVVSPGIRGRAWGYDFLGCSPHLLPGGPLDILLFVWVWAGSLVFATLFIIVIGRMVVKIVRGLKE